MCLTHLNLNLEYLCISTKPGVFLLAPNKTVSANVFRLLFLNQRSESLRIEEWVVGKLHT